ncbi:COMM domain-containing protein 2 [Tupaia chinensis]|uniref:COMM domain-containing protein 2 n=1 Tax=Tupaia chinensis TaxID=246437 RepID=L9L1B2_TUPCH|nr:COMM domain-containing protein 2 [Tupaia chinensis]
MLLDLSEEHKEHLAFLPQVDSTVVPEFGWIAMEFLRRGSNPKIYEDLVFVMGFSEEINKSLLQLYLDNRKEIRTILSELAPDLPSYHSLEWQLDVQLASRSLRQQSKPSVTMKLHLNHSGDNTTKVLQIDPATLLH